jgi:plastocyanin
MNPVGRRLALAIARTAASAAVLVAMASTVSAEQRTVHVGRGGSIGFEDEVSHTNLTQIHVGDTVTWVWDGTMEHSVTSGTCSGGNGGGGGYGGGYASTAACEDAHVWTSTGLQGNGFRFSWTFNAQGSYPYFCAMHQNAMTGKVIVMPGILAGGCTADDHTLCLGSGRFAATAHWTKTDGTEGDGHAIPLTDDSGYFWFFDATNIEAVTKVLNGCAIDSAYWVFAAGLTNVQVRLTVTDTQTGTVYVRDNPQGAAFQPIQDTQAFPGSCP